MVRQALAPAEPARAGRERLERLLLPLLRSCSKEAGAAVRRAKLRASRTLSRSPPRAQRQPSPPPADRIGGEGRGGS